MKYISTRGNASPLDFEQVLLAGLAGDGGLYVPETLPTFSQQQIASWVGLSYPELAFNVISPFVSGAIDDDELKQILRDTYAEFHHAAVAPLVQIAPNDWVLELFQGPTLAFKDFALQLLGRLLDVVLERRGEKVVILGATSGDTGSAAIEGCRHCENVDIFILHPYQRVSDVQRRQMTTVLSDNVTNIALKGSFDDCQNVVKACFNDQSFLPDGRRLVAVNSINWARIMAQIVYYFYAALALGAPERKVSFSVPTGNFGDIYAGYLAKQMGLPIDKLIIATNENDVLHRVLQTGIYEKVGLYHTLSPSMDISISSNFERLMFDAYQRDGAKINALMKQFDNESIALDDAAINYVRQHFVSDVCDDDQTCKTIADTHENTGYVLDPHSATGVYAAQTSRRDERETIVSLATAHPAKFPDAIERAGVDYQSVVPAHLHALAEKEERYDVLDNAIDAVKSAIISKLSN